MSAWNKQVDDIVGDLLAKRQVEARTRQLKSLGKLATPGLLQHLVSTERAPKTMALFGLQFCWSDEALEPVSRLLASVDSELRRMASIVIDRALGREGLAKACEPYVFNADPEVAGFAFNYAEAVYPDLSRMEKAIRNPALAAAVGRNLPRYYSKTLSTATRALLGDSQPSVALAAAVSLIYQGDEGPQVREHMRGWLSAHPAAYREIAAEYFTWHGDENELEALNTADHRESDPHARGAIRAAIESIARRRTQSWPGDHPPSTMDEDCPYRIGPAAAVTRTEVKQALYASETFEPRWMYRGQPPEQRFDTCRRARVDIMRLALAAPAPAGSTQPEVFPADLAPAQRFVHPVREYEYERSNSYGVHTDKLNRAFKSAVHVGDDVAWHWTNGTVVSIADGLVREARYTHSWGYIVVVEHEIGTDLLPFAGSRNESELLALAKSMNEPLTGSRGGLMLCSIYAHLGPFLHVTPGKAVQAGDKLGTIGRGYTWENGGYPAHLHFAVHAGPYEQTFKLGSKVDITYRSKRYRGKVLDSDAETTRASIFRNGELEQVIRSTAWLCGYVSTGSWSSRTHGRLNPQSLLDAFNTAE